MQAALRDSKAKRKPGDLWHMTGRNPALRLLVTLVVVTACNRDSSASTNASDDGGPGDAAGKAAVTAAQTDKPVTFDAESWRPPADSEIPNDTLGSSIRRGIALMTHTTDSLPAFAPGRINCTNCHLEGGRNAEAGSLAGSHARFPKYMERTGAVIALSDRINYCFTRSLAGNMLPAGSREMEDIMAYLAFISRGVPVGIKVPGADGLTKMPGDIVGDTTRGKTLFATTCVTCHGPQGEGQGIIPALWGAGSYSVGASMARVERAASFIWHNMPLGRGKTLTKQQAFDVAAYINSRPRPDSPGKQDDWPFGGAPKDVPYNTKSGHLAYRAPPLLPRANARGAVVPKPQRAASVPR